MDLKNDCYLVRFRMSLLKKNKGIFDEVFVLKDIHKIKYRKMRILGYIGEINSSLRYIKRNVKED